MSERTWDINLRVTCTDKELDALMEEVLDIADGREFGAVVSAQAAADEADS